MNNLDYNLNHFNLLKSSKWFYNLNYFTSRERAHLFLRWCIQNEKNSQLPIDMFDKFDWCIQNEKQIEFNKLKLQ